MRIAARATLMIAVGWMSCNPARDGIARADGLWSGPRLWSGVLVSADGYVVTCAHTGVIPGEAVKVSLPDGREAVGKAFGLLATEVRGSTVTVLGDGKPVAIGTIVANDGRILTKASELYGEISCRLPDGRTLPYAVHR